MADNRVVKVTLRAQVAEYKKGMQEAAQATETAAQKSRRELQELEDQLKEVEDASQLIGGALLAVGAVAAAGVGVAIAKATEFNQAMSHVAATGEDARNSFDALRQAALDYGGSTAFSATESANAIEEMAKAGVDAAEIIDGGLAGALDLAAAGGLGVAEAAETAATAMQMFGLEGKDMSHVADLLAAGAGKAMGDVSDLSAALDQGGLVAAATGLSIEETTAALAAFASQGLLGADAGTSLKTMLQRLTPQSAEAAAKFEELGISAYDANGQFVGLENFAGQLETAMKGLTPEARNAAMSVMFGSDAVRAANILYKEGADGIKDWVGAVDDQGYAAETAAARMDNLAGDWEQFTGALDTALITMGDAATGPARVFVQFITNMVDAFNDMPEWAQGMTMWGGVAVASIALIGGAALAVVPQIAKFKDALILLQTTLGKVSLIGGGVTLAIGAIIAAVGALAGVHADAEARAESYAGTLKDGAQSTADTYSMVADKMLEDQDAWDLAFSDRWLSGADAAEMLGMNVSEVSKIIADGGPKFSDLSKRVEDLRNNTNGAADALAKDLGVSTTEVRDAAYNLLPVLKTEGELVQKGKDDAAAKADAMEGLADETDGVAESSKTAADRYLEEAEATKAVEAELRKLIDALMESNNQAQDAESSNARYQNALAGIAEEVQSQRAAYEEANGTLDGFTASLDANTVTGSANRAMLSDVAGAAQDVAEKQYNIDLATMSADEATAKYNATLEAQRAKLVEQATAAGFSATEVDALVASIFSMPPEMTTRILADTATAKNQVVNFADTVRDVPGSKVTTMGAATDVAERAVKSLVGEIARVQSKTVTITAQRAGDFIGGLAQPNFQGGMYSQGVQEFAQGGFPSGIYDGVNGGLHKFAEREKGVKWEAYISGREADRDRNIGIAYESLRRMGVNGGGGSTTTVSAPITVQAVPGMSEEQVGLAAAEKLNYALRG